MKTITRHNRDFAISTRTFGPSHVAMDVMVYTHKTACRPRTYLGSWIVITKDTNLVYPRLAELANPPKGTTRIEIAA